MDFNFDLAKVLSEHEQSGKIYKEFLKVPTMSMGLYTHEVGKEVLQDPHTEDEVYFVMEGKGKFFHEGESIDVQKGKILFVPAHAKHHFHSVEEKLTILVIFAPAESSNRSAS